MKLFALAGLMEYVKVLMKKVTVIGLHQEIQKAIGAQLTLKRLKSLLSLD